MHYSTHWTTKLLQLLNDIVLAIAAVNDDREVAFVGERQVAIEPLLLHCEGSPVPIPVQPGFTDGDHARAPDHLEDQRPILLARLCRFVGVHADGGEDALVRSARARVRPHSSWRLYRSR